MADDKNGQYYSFSTSEAERFVRVMHYVAERYVKAKYGEEYTLRLKLNNQGKRSRAGISNGHYTYFVDDYGNKCKVYRSVHGTLNFKHKSIARCENRFDEYETIKSVRNSFFIANYEGNFELNVQGVPEGYLAVYNLFMHELSHVLDGFDGGWVERQSKRTGRWRGEYHGRTFIKTYLDIMKRLPFQSLWNLMGV